MKTNKLRNREMPYTNSTIWLYEKIFSKLYCALYTMYKSVVLQIVKEKDGAGFGRFVSKTLLQCELSSGIYEISKLVI